MDRVEVFHGSVWRRGWVRVLLTGQCYKVCFVATEEEHVFRHSHVRRLKVWEDGAWHDGPPKVATGEVSNKKADAVMMNDETPPPVITPQVTPIGNCNPSFSTSSFI
ncbi:hypothetical protein Bca101_034699 [Brassica carinata]